MKVMTIIILPMLNGFSVKDAAIQVNMESGQKKISYESRTL